MRLTLVTIRYRQGLIEPPKAARGHVRHVKRTKTAKSQLLLKIHFLLPTCWRVSGEYTDVVSHTRTTVLINVRARATWTWSSIFCRWKENRSPLLPLQVAVQTRKKYHQIQQRHSPCPATARRLLLSKLVSASSVKEGEASQTESHEPC